MSSRLLPRLTVVLCALIESTRLLGQRRTPAQPKRILIAHHLLLGDTLMLTALLAKLREGYPQAEIAMTVPNSLLPLYGKRPYGVLALAYDPRDAATLNPLFKQKGFDLALVPGDNRYALLARALGARWIVAFAHDRPAWKNWIVDELIPFPNEPKALADIFTQLAQGPDPQPYEKSAWPIPDYTPFELPAKPYAVLHVGARNPLRLWEPTKWRSIAEFLHSSGLEVVFSAAKHETEIVRAINPEGRYRSYAGELDLAQLWQLLSQARLLVTLDTGVAHLAKLTMTPTICLFGPGSAVLFGKGTFWRNAPFRSVTIENFPCRDQRLLFKRELDWVRHCSRGLNECAKARCMEAIDVEMVKAEIKNLRNATSLQQTTKIR